MNDTNCAPAITNKNSIIPKILSGDARIALAITEPDAGSDVQGLQTEAILSDDGTHIVVNGMKKVRTAYAQCGMAS